MKTLSIKYEDFDGAPSIYEYQYPTGRELLEIFPEARETIQEKIQDWLRVKGKLLCKETIPYLKKCNTLKDEFAKAFWKEAYCYFAKGFNAALDHLKRLRRLEAILTCPEDSRKFEDKLQKAKEAPIVEVYDFQRLRKLSRHYITLCPFHGDKSTSFYIYDDNSWWCFGCNKGGDSIDFVQQLHKFKFHEAVNYLVGGVK